jgi:hypothetical protein
MTFLIPDSWVFGDRDTDENGLATLPTNQIFITTDVAGLLIAVNNETAEVVSSAGSTSLRAEGPSGAIMSAEELTELTGGDENTPVLYYMLNTIDVVAPPPTPTETPSPTATPTATGTATGTSTATPTVTPTNSAP